MSAWSKRVAVVGGGAAGMMAAITAAQQGAAVVLLEKNEKLGKKLFITGKGRCNVTNDCAAEEVLKNVTSNPRFLYSALSAFPPSAAMDFFERNGCPLKVERGNRVFPVTDKAGSVIDALRSALRAAGVSVRLNTAVSGLAVSDGRITGLKTAHGPLACEAAILACGGCSYPATGSTGDGYALARALGHTVIEPVGSLVPLVVKGHECAQLQGLSLRNVRLRLKNSRGKTVFEDFGELLFTHFGLSGPLVLSASAHMGRKEEAFFAELDLKPALSEKQLDERLLRDFEKYRNRDFENALADLLPASLIPVVVRRSGVAPEEKVHSVTKQQRRALLETLKCLSFEIACKAPVEQAIVTAGGVKVSEVDPKTMESRLVSGLYFAGELLDLDAYTGGFNLQLAWATGRAAGLAAAQKEETP